MKREPDILWSFLIYWYSYQKTKVPLLSITDR